MKPKEVLAVAEDYAIMFGDDKKFNEIFSIYREFLNVRESAKKTLRCMYGKEVCEMLIGEK